MYWWSKNLILRLPSKMSRNWCYKKNYFSGMHNNLIYRKSWICAQTMDTQWSFFHWNPELLGLSWQMGPINSWAFEVFPAKLSVPISVQSVFCLCFPLSNHYFYKKLSIYIHIPNIYLGLGFEFEFGPQRIKDLAFVCL